MAVSVRFATHDDLDIVMRFDATDDKTFFRVARDPSYYQTQIQQQSVLLAQDGETIIGMVRWDFLWPERVPLLSWLYVLPEYRQQKLGDRLFFAALQKLQEMEYSNILLSACNDRPDIIALLEKEGLVENGRLEFPDGSYEIFFWLPLPWQRKKR